MVSFDSKRSHMISCPYGGKGGLRSIALFAYEHPHILGFNDVSVVLWEGH